MITIDLQYLLKTIANDLNAFKNRITSGVRSIYMPLLVATTL